jgi:hypothetical protein
MMPIDPGLFTNNVGYVAGETFDNGSGEKMWVVGGTIPVGMGAYPGVWSSTDGATWEFEGCVSGEALLAVPYVTDLIEYMGELWALGMGNDGAEIFAVILSSPDGIDWTTVTTQPAFGVRQLSSFMSHDGGMWVIGGADADVNILNDVWYSTDGITWIEVTPDADFPARIFSGSCVYDGKMWLFGGASNLASETVYDDIWYSTNGINWAQVEPIPSFAGRAIPAMVVHQDKMWLIGGAYANPHADPEGSVYNDAWYSDDGASWYSATYEVWSSPVHGGLVITIPLSYDNKLWLIGGSWVEFPSTQHITNEVWYSPAP